jgi:DNA-damage-inducible protein D
MENALTISTDSFEDFEESAKQNGVRYWDAHEFMRKLGYESYASFSGVINKAIGSCVQLGIQINEAFMQSTVVVDGRSVSSYRLTRFACFLTAMHADDKKPEVAAAKVYFAKIASCLVEKAIADDALPRLEVREDIKVGEKMLNSVARSAGIDTDGYAFFKDAGIRGMYNMSLKELMGRKGVLPKDTLYDFMGTTELAGNFFRITQTAERIKNKGVYGQKALQHAANDIGRTVRRTMITNSGIAPEYLPTSEDLNKVKSRLKSTNRGMAKLDHPVKSKKLRSKNRQIESEDPS